MNTAVLFMVFNRLEPVKKVLDAIRKARPAKLYVAADGPRKAVPGEREKVAEVRRYIENHIDWDCALLKRFQDENQGCKYAVSGAIDWFFSQEEQGIILEDDCLPSQSFFRFCSELLDKYHDDNRIMKIAGYNLLSGRYSYPFDYFFTFRSFTWGWASWRRAWKYNDLEMNHWTWVHEQKLDQYYPFNTETNHCFDQVLQGTDTWDYQWDFSMFCQHGLQIVPTENLIQNIGFGEEATHTKAPDKVRGALQAKEMTFPLKHPPEVLLPNREYEVKLEQFNRPPLLRRMVRKFRQRFP